ATSTPKRAKKNKENTSDAFACSDDLLRWLDSNTIHAELRDKRTTDALKQLCRENNLPVSGPKYALVARLIEHAKEGKKKREEKLLINSFNETSNHSTETQHLLDFYKVKTFSAANNLFHKKYQASKKLKSFEDQLAVLTGASKGFDMHLLSVLEGPRAGYYNGKYSEDGIDAQNDVAACWKEFLLSFESMEMSVEDFEKAIVAGSFVSKCDDYGFDPYFKLIGHELVKALEEKGKQILLKYSTNMSSFHPHAVVVDVS
ncbi:hypothetical protein BCR33DRAFT_716230, partial [Rhizoclosmatium globosum]